MLLRKKILPIVSALVGIVAINGSASASPTEDSLLINGKVPEKCEINVKATAAARDILDISIGDSSRLVGYAYEKCNDPAGYTVTMVGQNSGDFSGLFVDSVSSAKHPFAVVYNGTLVKKNIVTDSNEAAIDFVEKPIAITYLADPTLPATDGYTYSEQLKFSISAK